MDGLTAIIEIIPILLIIAAGIVIFSLINATLNTLYYFIRDKHWSWKWWFEIFKYGLSFLRLFIPTGSSSGPSSSRRSSSGRSSSAKTKGFGGGSSRGGGSGRSF